MDTSVRIDKWLWAARFFKTRGKAREAVTGGKVDLNGSRVKPGRALKSGDQLRIQRGEDVFRITVVELSTRRGPPQEALRLYLEEESDRREREGAAQERALQRAERASRLRRPDKRERRRIIRFRQGRD
ncbi:MAG: RNA-binding protein [Xanthomonadales bacterium]|nr:RNA-binding S4 domain-containing protein [Xanthomonadales bacterium]NIX13681.1 RNA-binding protein [Xanthomonadales bacterium]